MSWPRKNDTARLYRDSDGSYIFVNIIAGLSGGGQYDAIGNAMAGPTPSLASIGVSPAYLHSRCTRVEWSELPEPWRRAFSPWFRGTIVDPPAIRGFWRIGNMPTTIQV